MEPSMEPWLQDDEGPPQPFEADFLFGSHGPPVSCVTPLLDQDPSPDMEPLNLPPSREQAAPYPQQPHRQPLQHQQQPYQPPHPPQQVRHPTSIAPRTPILPASSPFLPMQTPQLQPPTPTSYPSPMSIATPLSVHLDTPSATIPNIPLTPVTPVSDYVAVYAAAVGHLADNTVEPYYRDAIDRAWAVAEEKKKLLRERLKRTPEQSRGKATRGSRREAAVSRNKLKEYQSALETELKVQIHNVIVLLLFIQRVLSAEEEQARKRFRSD